MIPHNRPLVTDVDRAAVQAVLSSTTLVGGTEIEALESAFVDRYGGGGACALSSGTAALAAALHVLEIGPGDPVAVPTYSCSALLNAVNFVGGEPVVVDVTAADATLSAEGLDRTGRRCRAAIAVHTFGARADTDALRTRTEVIEDCCQSLGSTWPQPVAHESARVLSVFSFYATKVITCGHGGLLHDSSGSLAVQARDYREFDQRLEYEPRFNLHLTAFQAAMARSQLERLDAIAARRRSIAHRYLEALPEHLVADRRMVDDGRLVYRFVVHASGPLERDELQRALAQRGVSTIVPIERHELLHRYLGLDPRDFPVAERLVETSLSLPVFPGLRDTEVDQVCDALAGVRP